MPHSPFRPSRKTALRIEALETRQLLAAIKPAEDHLSTALAAYKEKYGEAALKDFLRGYLGCVLY